MKSYLTWIPPSTVQGTDHHGRSYTSHFPGQWINSVPTLCTAVLRLFQDLGPFEIIWNDGLLCPFHPDVGTKKIRCCKGRRRACFGTLITPKLIPHRPDLAGGVVCYNWDHRFLDALEEIIQDRDRMARWPDDPQYVYTMLLDQVRQHTLWYAWQAELEHRTDPRYRPWLPPLPQHQECSGLLGPP